MRSVDVKIHKLKNGKYQVSYICPVDKKRKRFIRDTSREAKEYKAQIEGKFYQKDMSYFLNLPIGKLIQLHLERCPKSRLTSRGRSFREFYESFSRHTLQEVNTIVLREWFEQVKEKYDYSEKTLLHIKIQLNHFFRFLIESEILPSNPLSPIIFSKRIAPKRPRIFFSESEVKTILDNAKEFELENHYLAYFYPFVFALAQTGARRSEMIKLKWEDVDYKLNTLTFRETKVKDDRQIVMCPSLRKLIEHLPVTSTYVFTNEEGKPLYKNMVSRHQQLFREKYPMKDKRDWGFHALRHSFAYNYLKRGGDMYQLQAILGHYNITSTINTYGRIKASDDEMPSPYSF